MVTTMVSPSRTTNTRKSLFDSIRFQRPPYAVFVRQGRSPNRASPRSGPLGSTPAERDQSHDGRITTPDTSRHPVVDTARITRKAVRLASGAKVHHAGKR